MHMYEQLLVAYRNHNITDFLKECSLSELEHFDIIIYTNFITNKTYEMVGAIEQELEYRSS